MWRCCWRHIGSKKATMSQQIRAAPYSDAPWCVLGQWPQLFNQLMKPVETKSHCILSWRLFFGCRSTSSKLEQHLQNINFKLGSTAWWKVETFPQAKIDYSRNARPLLSLHPLVMLRLQKTCLCLITPPNEWLLRGVEGKQPSPWFKSTNFHLSPYV